MFKKIIFLIGVFFYGVLAQAHIPKLWYIVDQAAKKHGHGVYKISQLVEVETNGGPQTLQEDWYVDGHNKMFVTVKGVNNPLRYQALYINGKKQFIDGSSLKTDTLPKNWFEPYLFFKSAGAIKQYMASQKMIPSQAVHLTKENSAAKENFLKLGRFGGFVNIVVGQDTKLSQPASRPSLWLEQNIYRTRFVSLGGGVSMKASQFKEPSADFHFPMKRVIEWSGNKATIKTTGVTYVGNKTTNASYFSSSRLNVGKLSSSSSRVNQFYSRFR